MIGFAVGSLAAAWCRRGSSALKARFVIALLLVCVLLFFPPASAHVVPLQTFPGAGDRLAEAPTEVWVDFSRKPDPETLRLRVLEGGVTDVGVGEPRADGVHVALPLAPDLPESWYLVKWEMTSAVDGHYMSGSWSFTVGGATLFETREVESAPFPWAVAIGKGLAFIGLAMVCGGVATRAHVLPARARARLGGRLEWFEFLGAALQVVGLAVLVAGQARVTGISALEYVRDTTFGRGLGSRLALAVAILVWFLDRSTRASRWGRRVDIALAGSALVVYGAYSHTAAALPFGLGMAVDAVHLASVMVWTGGLACLVLLLRSKDAERDVLKAVGQRFGSMATACIVVLSITGVVMLGALLGWDVRGWLPHLRTGYGRLLGLMILLALGMAGVGALNRYVFLPRFLDSLEEGTHRSSRSTARQEARRRGFRSNVAREALLGVVVFALAAGATNLSPALLASESDALRVCSGAGEPIACYTEALKYVQATQGSIAAFDVLANMTAANSTIGGNGHFIGHELGRHAFQVYGTIQETLANCSPLMQQACIHGALQAYFSSLPGLDREVVNGVCRRGSQFANFTCIHGLGHGVLLATNYALMESLALCGGLDTVPNREFCYSGVFMQNVNSYMDHHGSDRHSSRNESHAQGNPTDLHYPCNVVPPRFRSSCWLYQPQLILFLNGYDVDDAFAKCATLPRNNSNLCSEGMGAFFAGFSSGDPAAVSTSCSRAKSALGRVYCVRGFVRARVDYHNDPAAVLPTCGAIADVYKAVCYHSIGYEGRPMVGLSQIVEICGQAGDFETECRRGAGLLPRRP